jgi:hypothetical protein
MGNMKMPALGVHQREFVDPAAVRLRAQAQNERQRANPNDNPVQASKYRQLLPTCTSFSLKCFK